MKVFDAVLLVILFITLGVGIYILMNFTTLFSEPVDFTEFSLGEEIEYQNGTQFYSNLRYRDRVISYEISESCDDSRKADVFEAFDILEKETELIFNFKEDGEIKILCSDIAPEPEQEGHFVAGEGGPSNITRAGQYNVIYAGKVALYREESCNTPQIALHEIIHALGFEHNDNPNSIMYPVTDCKQEIDEYIIDTLNAVYAIEAEPDLVITGLSASKNGRFLDFSINVSNYGLAEVRESKLMIYDAEVSNKKISEFDLGDFKVGLTRTLSVSNDRIPGGIEKVRFEVFYSGTELDKENNIVELSLVN